MKIVFKLIAIIFALADITAASETPPLGKVYRVGYIVNRASIGPAGEAFRKRLRELGYTEGQNLLIQWAFTLGDLDRTPGAVAELINFKPDCIVAGGVGLTRAAKQASGSIPIVMANADEDPVEYGLVASLARPGGNVTGFTNISSELAGQRLELLKETVPTATRLAILSAGGPGGGGHIKESQRVAPSLGVRLQSLEVPNPDVAKIEGAFKSAIKEHANGLVVVNTGGMSIHRRQISGLAVKNRVPAMYTSADATRDGGLMS